MRDGALCHSFAHAERHALAAPDAMCGGTSRENGYIQLLPGYQQGIFANFLLYSNDIAGLMSGFDVFPRR